MARKKKDIKRNPDMEVLFVEIEKGTKEKIDKICSDLYFGKTVSQYAREVIGFAVINDWNVYQSRRMWEEGQRSKETGRI